MTTRQLLELTATELTLNRNIAPNRRELSSLLHKIAELLICYINNPEPDDDVESAAIQLAGLALYIAETTPGPEKN